MAGRDSELERFDGRVVAITGAANGLGRATAMTFAGTGARLALIDRDEAGLAQVGDAIEADAERPLCLAGDISTRDACHHLIGDIADRLGGLDVLCNVAGVLGPVHVRDVSEALWHRLMAVNLAAPFWLSQAALPHLIARRGNIVNVASSGAFMGEAYLVPYCVSKAGLVHMTRSMAIEYLHHPVRINAVAPGGMMTNIMHGDGFPPDADPALLARLAPTRPVVPPEAVADLIRYLASDRAANIHGACLSSDGGVTAG